MNFSKRFLKKLSEKLKRREKELLQQKQEIAQSDSFKDPGRTVDNSFVDIEVDEQVGHERSETFKNVLDRNIVQIRRALGAIKRGKYGKCDICGAPIGLKRLKVFPTATLCTACRAIKEAEKARINRKKILLTSR